MFIDVPKDKVVVSVGHEPYARTFCYVGLDRRRQYLFVATSLRRPARARRGDARAAPASSRRDAGGRGGGRGGGVEVDTEGA